MRLVGTDRMSVRTKIQKRRDVSRRKIVKRIDFSSGCAYHCIQNKGRSGRFMWKFVVDCANTNQNGPVLPGGDAAGGEAGEL